MQKYKVLKGGWTVKAVNPYEKYPIPHSMQYDEFEAANPILPLTHQQDEGIEVSGELVWYVKEKDGYRDIKPEPERVDEAFVWDYTEKGINGLRQKFQHLDFYLAVQPVTTNSKEEKPLIISEPTGSNYNNVRHVESGIKSNSSSEKSPLPIASASIETDLKKRNEPFKAIARRYETGKIGFYDALFEASELKTHWQSQTTQQPLIELLEKRIDFYKKTRHGGKYELGCFDTLTSLLTELNQLNNGH